MEQQHITYLGSVPYMPMRQPQMEAKRFLDMGELIQRDAGHLGDAMDKYARYKQDEARVQDIKNFLRFDTDSNKIALSLRDQIEATQGDYAGHKKLAENAMKSIGSMQFDFSDDLNRAKFEAQRQRKLDDINYGVAKGINDGQIDDAKKDLNANLKMYEEQKDYNSYRNSVAFGRQKNLITQGEADLMNYRANVNESQGNLDKLLLEDPNKAFEAMDNGEFDILPSDTLLRYRKSIESILRSQSKVISLSEKDKADMAAGKSVTTKYRVRDGATEQEWVWRDHFNKVGNYEKYNGDIRTAWMDDIANMPVLTTKEERNKWIEGRVKQWCSYDIGYGVDENEFRLLAQDKMDELSGEVDTTKRIDVNACLSELSDKQIVPLLQYKVDEAKNAPYLTDDRRKKAESAASAEAIAGRGYIRAKVELAMAAWRVNHKNAGYDKEMEQFGLFVARFANAEGFNDEEKMDAFGRDIASSLEGKDLREKGGVENTEAQKQRNRDHMASQKTFFPWENQGRMTPASECNVIPVKGSEEGAYLPKAEYEALKKKFGNVYVAVDLPNKVHTRVPVLGWYEGENSGVQLTTGARRSLANFNPMKAKVRFFTGEGKSVDGKASPESVFSMRSDASDRRNINDLTDADEGVLPVENSTPAADLESPLLPSL